MASLYWLEAALPGLLPTFWMSFGVGLPWAFAVLSPTQWRSRILVAALALALGPACVTAWMLLLGVAGAQFETRLLSPEAILSGSAVIAIAGAAIGWRKRRGFTRLTQPGTPLRFDEKLIIAMIVIAVVLRWIHTSFWPFTAYDALWVYGYQGRLFFLEGNIPATLDYYPPFLSLQIAYVQIIIGGINDHAARMVLPMLHIGSILAAFLLGERLVGRRIGLLCAALWGLHPYVGQWAYVGDLEIPLTFSFTLAAVFFLQAWLENGNAAERRRSAILAGVLLGIALFTKPTAGAFAWGVLLLLAVDLAFKRFALDRWLPRVRVVFWTGLACLPLGGLWYLRNLALGHEAITFPKSVWLTRALRSGDYLAPFLAMLVLIFIAIALSRRLSGRQLVVGAVGIALLLSGALASNSRLFPARANPPASFVQLAEALAIVIGLGLIAVSLRPLIMGPCDAKTRRLLSAGSWSVLLALPYFVTFFYSYSYHYRLGFAIVPLVCMPTAIALGRIFTPERIANWRGAVRRAYYAGLVLLCAPGIVSVATDVSWSSVWMLREDLDGDARKYQIFNPSLMEVVTGLADFERESRLKPIVLAPGEERLPFFFPQSPIIDELATSLAEIQALGATHFVYGAKAREAYVNAGIDPLSTQLVSALGRDDLFELKKSHYDGTISYDLYEIFDLNSRLVLPERITNGFRKRLEIIFENKIRLFGHVVYPWSIRPGVPITYEPTYHALKPLVRDYEFVLQLEDPLSGEVMQEWRIRPAAHRHGYYAAQRWDLDEYIHDLHVLYLDAEVTIPRREDYNFRFGVWDPLDRRFLPLELDGEAAGEFYELYGEYDVSS